MNSIEKIAAVLGSLKIIDDRFFNVLWLTVFQCLFMAFLSYGIPGSSYYGAAEFLFNISTPDATQLFHYTSLINQEVAIAQIFGSVLIFALIGWFMHMIVIVIRKKDIKLLFKGGYGWNAFFLAIRASTLFYCIQSVASQLFFFDAMINQKGIEVGTTFLSTMWILFESMPASTTISYIVLVVSVMNARKNLADRYGMVQSAGRKGLGVFATVILTIITAISAQYVIHLVALENYKAPQALDIKEFNYEMVYKAAINSGFPKTLITQHWAYCQSLPPHEKTVCFKVLDMQYHLKLLHDKQPHI